MLADSRISYIIIGVMSNTTIPNKLVLTCTITGKVVTWTNKAIIAKKIEQFGSLEAFVAQFKCKGAVPGSRRVTETREQRALSFGKARQPQEDLDDTNSYLEHVSIRYPYKIKGSDEDYFCTVVTSMRIKGVRPVEASN